MVDRYWISNQTSSTAKTANTAGNWNTVADSSGSSGVPAIGDDCIFGHADTLSMGRGSALCSWDLAQVNSITTLNDYRYETKVVLSAIIFAASANTLKITENWKEYGYRVGMWITISGSASNSGSFYISAISAGLMTINAVSADEAIGPSITINSESSIDLTVSTLTIRLLALDGTLKNTSGSNKTVRFVGALGANNRYITNDLSASILNQDDITYDISTGSGGTISFDDGPYPKVTCTEIRVFTWDYIAPPTSTAHGSVSFYSLSISNAGASVSCAATDPRNDVTKIFKVLTTSTFVFTPTLFDAGLSTWHFKMNGPFPFPTSGIGNYGAGDGTFMGLWYNVVLDTPASAGQVCSISAGRTLNVNSLTVEGGAVLQGAFTKNSIGSSAIVSVSRPTINGAWNFSQVADGIYSSIVSETYPITPSHSVGGRVQLSDNAGKFISDARLTWTSATSTLLVNGKLDVTGLIDPTGMQFDRQASNPGSVDTVWVNASGTLMFGASAAGGGGGSGDITSVVAGTGLSGGATSGAATLNLAAIADDTILANVSGGSLAPAALNVAGIKTLIGDATTSVHGLMTDTQFDSLAANVSKLSGIEASADVTDTANVTAAGALMDSEVDADIKTLSLPASTTISAYGKTLIDDADAAAARTTLNLGTAATTATGAYATAAQGATADTALQAGMPVSLLLNDAGYLTAATTPTGTWGRWESTSNYDDKDEGTNHLMLVDDSTNFTRIGTLTGFSSGTFTATAATAGTYIVYAQAQYGTATNTPVPETSGLKYQAQLLIYHGSTMEGFGRYLRNGFWADEHYCTTTVVTLADGEELEVYYKLNDPNTATGLHFKLKNGGGNPATYVMMVKIA